MGFGGSAGGNIRNELQKLPQRRKGLRRQRIENMLSALLAFHQPSFPKDAQMMADGGFGNGELPGDLSCVSGSFPQQPSRSPCASGRTGPPMDFVGGICQNAPFFYNLLFYKLSKYSLSIPYAAEKYNRLRFNCGRNCHRGSAAAATVPKRFCPMAFGDTPLRTGPVSRVPRRSVMAV